MFDISSIRVLVACEHSGVVRDAFANEGCDAWSVDFLPSETIGDHLQCDVRDVLDQHWDLMICHPPCQYLCSSGMHWTTRGYRDPQHTEDALDLVRLLLNADIHFIALENPVGVIGTRVRKADQSIQPYQFGADASKRTCLWLKNLPKLQSTEYVKPRIVNGKPRWSNQLDSGQNILGQSKSRWAKRSRTYPGIAKAMVNQWLPIIKNFRSKDV